MFDSGDVLRYAFGKGFWWAVCGAVALHPSCIRVGSRKRSLCMVLSVTTGNTFSMPFFDILPLPKIEIFCKVVLKCCYCRVARRAFWLSERVGNLFLSPAFFFGSNVRTWRHTQRFLWRHRVSGYSFPLFSGGGYRDSSLFPFPKGKPLLRRGRHP